MSQNKLKYELALDNTQFERATIAAQAKLKAMAGGMSRAVAPVNSAFSTLGKGLALGVAAGVAAAIISLGKLKSFAADSIALANEQEDAEVRLAGVLRATGSAAGFSLQQLKAYAGQLQTLTTVGDEVTIAGMSILATFKEIKGDQFKEATKAAIDMSTVMKTDLKSSIVQVGKALNDPIKGMSALSRVGVSFTQSQKDAVKSMVDLGNVAGAQKLILDELKSEFGGVADALRGTFAGSVISAKNAYGDLKEEIGFTVTKNQFFIESAKRIEQLFIGWTANIKANSGEWRGWAKNSALAVMEFVADFGDGMNSTYKVLQQLNGVLNLSYSSILSLAGGFQYLFEQSNNLFGRDDKAKYWADAQIETAKMIDSAMMGAADSFRKADDGIPIVEAATKKIRELKEELSKLDTKEFDPASALMEGTKDAAKKIEVELKLINGVWTNVYKDVQEESGSTTDQLTKDTESLENPIDKMGLKFIDVFDKAAAASAKARAKIIKDLEAMQAAAAKVNVSPTSSNASGYAKGGNPFFGGLRGFGGGDRRLILVEDGEHVIRKEAVAKFGHGFFQRFNSFQFPKIQGFATGGAIGAGAGGGTYNLNLSFSGEVSTPSRNNARDMAKMVLVELQKMHKGASR